MNPDEDITKKQHAEIKEIEDLLKSGALDNADVATLNRHLQNTIGRQTVLYDQAEIVQNQLRHLIGLRIGDEDRRKTLFWARVAAWAAIIGGLAGIGLVVLAIFGH